MKYLCIGYLDRERMDALGEAGVEAVMAECGPHMERLAASGKLRLVAGLGHETAHIKRRDGRAATTDGPYLETKEIIGSVFLIEAEDMDEAIRLASLHPTVQIDAGAELGWRLEVRSVHTFQTG